MDPKVCRERARECHLFAKDCADLFAKEALQKLAAEFHSGKGSPQNWCSANSYLQAACATDATRGPPTEVP
jgi:hypothetical protein